MRSLERKYGAICRAVAVKVAEGHKAAKPGASSEGEQSPVTEAGGEAARQRVWLSLRTALLGGGAAGNRARFGGYSPLCRQMATAPFLV